MASEEKADCTSLTSPEPRGLEHNNSNNNNNNSSNSNSSNSNSNSKCCKRES